MYMYMYIIGMSTYSIVNLSGRYGNFWLNLGERREVKEEEREGGRERGIEEGGGKTIIKTCMRLLEGPCTTISSK